MSSLLLAYVQKYFYRYWAWGYISRFGEIDANILWELQKFYKIMALVFLFLSYGYEMGRAGHMEYTYAVIGIGVCYLLILTGYRLRLIWKKEMRIFLLVTFPFCVGAKFGYQCTSNVPNVLLVAASMVFLCFWEASCWWRFGRLEQYDKYYLRGVILSASVVHWIYIAKDDFGFDFVQLKKVCAAVVCFSVYVAMYTQELVLNLTYQPLYLEIDALTFFTDAPAICLHCAKLVLRTVRRQLSHLFQ